MSTLLIPCAGRKFIDGIPQYLTRHPNGSLLIERAIEGVYSECYDRLIIVILKEDSDKYDAKSIIETELNHYNPEIVLLDKETNGPADTVFQAITECNISGSLVVKDADNYLRTKEPLAGNFVAGLDLNTWERDIHNLRNKSFLIINEQRNLLDIIEKQVRSDVICLGLYGFNKAEDIVRAYNHLNDASYPISRLYLSHIISYLIGYYGRVFHYIESSEYENWGDDRLWKDMQRDYTLYFIDLDHVMSNTGELSDSSREKLKILQERGASFIGFTVNDAECKSKAIKLLKDAGLNFLKVVYGCPYSVRKEIIDSNEVLERKVIEL